jgi:hypothetical protein
MRTETAYNDTWKNGKLIRREVVEITYDENDNVVSEEKIETLEYDLDNE